MQRLYKVDDFSSLWSWSLLTLMPKSWHWMVRIQLEQFAFLQEYSVRPKQTKTFNFSAVQFSDLFALRAALQNLIMSGGSDKKILKYIIMTVI